MKLLTHRVLPTEAKQVRDDLASILRSLQSHQPLTLGASCAAVTALQRQLKAAGLYSGALSGTFDAATQAAVQELQRQKHLGTSGSVGGSTLNALKSTELFVKDGFKQSAHVGQSGSDIKSAERMLAKLGYLSQTKADGVFDASTAAAVERYRKADHQVPDKGHAINQKLFQELKKASHGYDHGAFKKREIGSLKAHQRLDALTAKAAAHGIGPGAKGRAVLNLEKHLEAAGYDLGNANKTFGPRTAAALRAFQHHTKGLDVTGVCDAKTWAALRSKLFAAKNGTSPAQSIGERDGAVLKLEQKLKKMGFKLGKVDGTFDAKTARAVRRFQKKHHLKQSGEVGSRTMKAIDKQLAANSQGAAVRKILGTARHFIGYHEGAGNSNRFSRAMGRPAEAWCADFVSYCARKAGLHVNTASAQGVANYLSAHHTWKGRHNPKPGDAVTFRWDGSHGWADHVGIVEKVFRKNGQLWVQTIEGNSADQVRRKQYPASSSVINGFGRIV